MTLRWIIVGVDRATQEAQLGLSRAVLHESGELELERVTLGTAGESAAASISQWIGANERYVLALDAPLGWPKALGSALARHSAGEPLKAAADALFRRDTDRLVHKHLRKLPPDVGADRVARTSRAALDLLREVRAHAGRALPLAWQQGADAGVIEVFPAATLLARNLSAVGYKANTTRARHARKEILDRLAGEMRVRPSRDVLVDDVNLFDAALCALAGADFARGLCVAPEDPELARKEGFIWFRASGQGSLFAER
jgi:predicted RNase H-like nuclease